MSRYRIPKRFGVPEEFLPDRKIDRAVVRNRLAKSNLLAHEDEVCAFLDQALADYQRAKMRDEAVAWPSEVEALLVRVQTAAISLRLTSEADATILRATSVSPFAYADLQETLDRLTHDLRAVLKETGDPAKGGGQAVRHARHRGLAERFWRVFEAKNWPTETSANSLMPQLLKHVLELVGEGRGTLTKLLKEAKPDLAATDQS